MGQVIGAILGLVPALLSFGAQYLRSRGEASASLVAQEKGRLDAAGAERARQSSVVLAGMQFRIWWVAWSLAAVPTALWHGWIMLDSGPFSGILPDALVPPAFNLELSRDILGNLFYTGTGMAGVQALAALLLRWAGK